MHFLALFHTARTLSGSLRSPPSPRGEGFVRRYSFSTYACIRFNDAGIAVLSYRSLPHWGRGTASAVDRVLSLIVDLRRSPSLFFIPLEPYPARFVRRYSFSTYACIRFDDARKAVSSYRSLPHWEGFAGGTVFSFLHSSHAKTTVSYERSFLCVLLA